MCPQTLSNAPRPGLEEFPLTFAPDPGLFRPHPDLTMSTTRPQHTTIFSATTRELSLKTIILRTIRNICSRPETPLFAASHLPESQLEPEICDERPCQAD